MEEIATGIWHWTSTHPRWGIVVHSYFLPEERVAIDPLAGPDVLDRLAKAGRPEHVLLTNRHHYRSSADLVERFGATVHAVRQGLPEFTHGEAVEPFDFGDTLPGGIVAYEVGAICPDETALHIPARQALALADGAVRDAPDGPLAFVPDNFMDEPEKTKDGLRDAYRRIVEDLEFEHLLLAHGPPVVGGGREALRAFAEGR